MSFDVPAPVSRRVLLTALIAGASVPALAGCGIHLEDSVAAGSQEPNVDERARRAVVAKLREAYAAADELAGSKSGSGKSGSGKSGDSQSSKDRAATLDRVRTMLAGQLAALGAGTKKAGTKKPGTTADASDDGSHSTSATSDAASPTVQSLVKSINAVQRASLRRLNRVSGVFARRLAGIAAASATAAHALGSATTAHVPAVNGPRQQPTGKPSSPVPVSTPSSDAATALLHLGQGLYEAIYGYEVLTVRLSGSAQTFARRRLGDLRRTATEVATQVRDGGADPARPRAGYSLPYSVHDAATATKFAATIERRLALDVGAAVTAVPAGTRGDAAEWLTESALAHWQFSEKLPAVPGSKLPKALSSKKPAGTGSGTGSTSGHDS